MIEKEREEECADLVLERHPNNKSTESLNKLQADTDTSRFQKQEEAEEVAEAEAPRNLKEK